MGQQIEGCYVYLHHFVITLVGKTIGNRKMKCSLTKQRGQKYLQMKEVTMRTFKDTDWSCKRMKNENIK